MSRSSRAAPRAAPKMFPAEVLEGYRAEAPAFCLWGPASHTGSWRGGRVYVDEFGDVVFIPVGQSRADCATRRLTYLGDGFRNTVGWGDRSAPVAKQSDVVLSNPVRP